MTSIYSEQLIALESHSHKCRIWFEDMGLTNQNISDAITLFHKSTNQAANVLALELVLLNKVNAAEVYHKCVNPDRAYIKYKNWP